GCRGVLAGDEHKAEGLGLASQAGFTAGAVLLVVVGEAGFVVGVAGGAAVIDDPGGVVRGGGDGVGRAAGGGLSAGEVGEGQAGFTAGAVLLLVVGEAGFVVGLAGGQQVIDDPGEFVRGGGDGLGRAEVGALSSEEVADGAVAAAGRVGGHAQRVGRAAGDLA